MNDVPTAPADPTADAVPRPRAAAAGLLATAAALGAGELASGILPGAPSPILSVGRLVVDLQPPGAKEFVVELFGTADKLALEIGIVVVSLLVGAGLGLVARRRFGAAASALVGFAGLGFISGLRDPDVVPALAAVGTAATAATGVIVLGWFLGGGRRAATESEAGASMPDWSRRGLLVRAGAVAAGSLAAVAVGRDLLEASRRPPEDLGDLPSPSGPASVPDGAELEVEGITPLVVPNEDFYRIDTALIVPNVDRAAWRLRVYGMVDREVTLSYADLIALGVFEQYVTIACVSNRVGGNLIGNALWSGVRLRDVLGLAGVRPGASQLVGRSIDEWTAGMPTAWIMDESREPMIALGMNGEPLPREHGFPARLIVPGLYGYVSATKWLAALELTTLEAYDAYWVPLGWSKEAPILTQSRIDTPRRGSRLPAGTVTIGGVAWAMDRGVAAVEVSIDGEWRPAETSEPISEATWVQWRHDWTATPGEHEIAVRATDGDGVVQTAERTRPDPDGARGHHSIRVTVA